MKEKRHKFSSAMLSVCLLICFFSAWVYAKDPIVFNDNGAWCWYQDERVIVHDGKLIIGSVANASGTDGAARNGNIEVVEYDIAAGGPAIRTVLHANLQADDHDTAAYLPLPDNRILAMYAKHGSDSLIRYRISSDPNDATGWSPEVTFTRAAGVTYSNVYRLSAENGGNGRIYDFYRGENYNPNFVTSDDNGQTWNYGVAGVSTDGHLIRKDGHRPYVRYTSNNVDKIHFITTEGHPRDYNNSIYYGCLYQGNLYAADGTRLHDLAAGPIAPESLMKLYQGGVNNVAWTTGIRLDSNGFPYIAFSVQMNQDMNDLRYFYGRWDGTQWHVNEMAFAGSALYSAEADYSGLVALDPHNPNVVYISADVHPVTGQPLISSADGQRHYELFRGTTTDMGAGWQWEYITKNSTQDNIRPIVPEWDGGTILLWLRGTYWSYTNYDLDVVGMFDPESIISNEPVIRNHPVSAGVPLGQTATFDIYATSPLEMSYAWYKVNSGGADIPAGANSRTLTLRDVQVGDTGQYYCVVTNDAGSATSGSASLVIADLSAHWPMENNYTDVTGNGYNASAVGSPGFAEGVYSGQAISLGGGSYLSCGNSGDLTLKDGGTIAAWIKTGGLTNAWASVVTKGRFAWRLCRNNTSSFISFHFNSPGQEYQANGDMTVVDNTWHHLAATYDGQSIKLYVDGRLDAFTSTSEGVNESTDLVYIGSRTDNPTGRCWDGMIDEVRIYSFAMDAKTIQLLYEQNRSCYQANPYDLTADCLINLDDLIVFADSWLESGIDPPMQICVTNSELDLTGPGSEPDCKVNLYEFADMASMWMECYRLPTPDCPSFYR